MEALSPVQKASVSTLLFGLGIKEEEYLREAEADLVRLMGAAGTKPLNFALNATFSEVLSEVGEAPLEETFQRAQALLGVLEMPNDNLKETLIDLLSVDVIDMIAMMVEHFGGDADEVYWSFSEIKDKEARARAAVSTFANLLLESLRKELA